jgi:CRISPR-associated protein Cas6/Cse3/CasE subtype I-E
MPNAYDYLNGDLTAYALHQDIWTFFPGVKKEENKQKPFIFSVQGTKILMVSSIKPVCPNSLWKLETRSYNPIVEQGQGLMFELTFCPSYDKNGNKCSYIANNLKPINAENGTRRDQTDKLIQDWFDRRIERLGFKVHQFEIIKDITRIIPKPDGPYKFHELSLKGALEVLDVSKLLYTVFHGIGRAKRNGCGLLLLS